MTLRTGGARFLLLALVATMLFAATLRAAPDPNSAAPGFGTAIVSYGDGRPRETVTTLERGHSVWFSARDLSGIFGAPRWWRSDLGRLLFKNGGHEAAFITDSDVAILDRDTPIHLPVPALFVSGDLWIPIEAIVLSAPSDGGDATWIDETVRWSEATHRLEVGEPEGRLVAVQSGGSTSGRIDFVAEGRWEWRLASAERGRFQVSLRGASFDPDTLRIPPVEGAFSSLSVVPTPDGAELRLSFAPAAVGYALERNDRPARLSIVVSTDPLDRESGRVTSFSGEDVGSFGSSGFRAGRAPIDTVMIDPGAGGRERGASAKGIVEADVTLDLARSLAQRLRDDLGVVALLTRDEDRDLTDVDRTGAANVTSAGLFLSLHCDAHPSPAVTGPRAVVAGYRDRPPGGVPADLASLGFTSWDAAQKNQIPRAFRLASRLTDELSQALGVPSRGVEEWPLPLLLGARMPAVYLDIDTITAPGAERRLSATNREAIVAALVRGIDAWRKEAP